MIRRLAYLFMGALVMLSYSFRQGPTAYKIAVLKYKGGGRLVR